MIALITRREEATDCECNGAYTDKWNIILQLKNDRAHGINYYPNYFINRIRRLLTRTMSDRIRFVGWTYLKQRKRDRARDTKWRDAIVSSLHLLVYHDWDKNQRSQIPTNFRCKQVRICDLLSKSMASTGDVGVKLHRIVNTWRGAVCTNRAVYPIGLFSSVIQSVSWMKTRERRGQRSDSVDSWLETLTEVNLPVREKRSDAKRSLQNGNSVVSMARWFGLLAWKD